MRINITVICHNRLEFTRLTLESLLDNTGGDFTLHVVDNASSDGTQEYLAGLAARHARVKVFALRRNMGLCVAANLGWAAFDADYYIKLDNDILVEDPAWLKRLTELAGRNPDIGMLGYRCGNWPYALQDITLESGDIFRSSACCNGGCVLIPRRAHELLGFWNEDYGLYGFEDLDYSERAHLLGLRTGYVPLDGAVQHLGCTPEFDDAELVSLKRDSTSAKSRGERLFVLNRFMFKQGLRPLYVERRYLPRESAKGFGFSSNPSYMPLARLQEELLEKLDYSVDEEGVSLDVAALALTGSAFSPK